MLHTFTRNDLTLGYYDNQNAGPVLVFQHGLTGDHQQILSSYLKDDCRLIVLECRAHGGSDTGPVEELGIATFAADLKALLDHLHIDRAAFAGISMGAATVARFAALWPDMVSSLALVRPSWFDRPSPRNMAIFSLVADYYDLYGPQEGKTLFAATDAFRELHEGSPDNAASLLNIFARGPAENSVPLLRRLITCDPGLDLPALTALSQNGVPVTVLGTADDVVHPLRLAINLAEAIPGAKFVELFSKSRDKTKHATQLTETISSQFVHRL